MMHKRYDAWPWVNCRLHKYRAKKEKHRHKAFELPPEGRIVYIITLSVLRDVLC